MTTALYNNMIATETAFNADVMNLDLCNVADRAREVYYIALAAKRMEWEALPNGEAKGSAEDNAHDSVADADDQLDWFELAIRSYEINLGDGMV